MADSLLYVEGYAPLTRSAAGEQGLTALFEVASLVNYFRFR